MKTLSLQIFDGGESKPTQITLDKDQEALVDKYGWPDALQLTQPNETRESDLNVYELYTLEDFDGSTATYTKVPHPLFVCQPSTTT